MSAGPLAGGPIASPNAIQWSPSSVVTCRPSAVPMTTVSPLVTMPSGATYCHSGPSARYAQFFQVWPVSVERPHPLPTVPYQISPLGPKAIAFTKSNESEVVSPLLFAMCRQVSGGPPARGRTKIPRPYVPIQMSPLDRVACVRILVGIPAESGRVMETCWDAFAGVEIEAGTGRGSCVVGSSATRGAPASTARPMTHDPRPDPIAIAAPQATPIETTNLITPAPGEWIRRGHAVPR